MNDTPNIPINQEERENAYKESVYLYGYLRKKFCNDNIKDLDIILNALCFSLARLIEDNVRRKDQHNMIQIISKIITQCVAADNKNDG